MKKSIILLILIFALLVLIASPIGAEELTNPDNKETTNEVIIHKETPEVEEKTEVKSEVEDKTEFEVKTENTEDPIVEENKDTIEKDPAINTEEIISPDSEESEDALIDEAEKTEELELVKSEKNLRNTKSVESDDQILKNGTLV